MSGPLAGRRVVVVNWRDLAHPSAGGSEHHAWHLARGLVEAGAEVELLTARPRGQARCELRDGITVDRAGGTLGFYPLALLRLLRRRRRIDAVVDPSCGIPTFTPLVLRRRTPVLLVVHHVHQDQFGLYFPAPLAWLGRVLERRAMPRVYRRARTVAVSDSTRAEMRARLGWRGEVGLLPNGADLPERAVEAAEKDPARIVVLGRLVAHKRVDAVLEAFAAVAAERPVTLDVVGAGPELEPLRAEAARRGLADRVTLHGFVDDARKAELLARAAVHVCASDAEGWGQVVVEAAAHGTPTIARDVPGLRDSVVDGVTGRLLPETAAPLAQRLAAGLRAELDALEAPGARATTARACRAHADAYGWPRMRRDAAALVASLLGADAPAHPVPHDRPRPAAAGVLTER
ncbi:glycosyltransferase family 4 protein [Nocardioides sp. TRM66260-LWL]|uniref:glycosyltransferase family 4 protein n=1 Tax=Nocardioides sp. TRM66260-LWL TaxID=2874478 RepID=UPI001CC52408|nr:glycosyltransferase family 4 protein [Nocardioides sp. TRM66260-LWL]MBZ5733694.1 glycosyltransferase family 4 protein [Nocardioides sp. TRM66260-LWL]